MTKKDNDVTLSGLAYRMESIENTVEALEHTLAKMVTLTQRIQWTFTGLVIYYIIDNMGLGVLAKLLAKGIIL